MKNTSTVSPAVGSYHIIRSSESKSAMICWNTPKYNKSSKRWFEASGCGFASWRDAKYLQETDDLEMEEFRLKHPEFPVKESFWEIEYGKKPEIIAKVWIFLVEYENGRSRSFSFDLKNINKQEWKKWEDAVEGWHATNELVTPHFSCYPCCGPWEER
jgi:hypothetical protein